MGIQLVFRNCAIDPAVAFRHFGIKVVCAKHNLQSPGAADEQRQSLQSTSARNQAGTNLGLAEDGPLTTGETDVAAQREFAATTAHAAPDNRNAEHAAGCETLGAFDPGRNAKAAAWLRRAVVGNKKVRVGALECDDLQACIGLNLDLGHEVV